MIKPTIFRRIAILLIALGIAIILAFLLWKPRVFTYHSKVFSKQNISGCVFKSPDGTFIINLDDGQQLIVQQDLQKVFLRTSSKEAGLRVGKYLFIGASAVNGLDLSKSESFSRQAPVVTNGTILIHDPKSQNGDLFFPIN
jgi:hypothetical protein